MGLSHDIISEFVKITNDNKEKQKEGIVYATIVQTSDGKYVKIDGSDLLTPTNTTTDIEDGERVTVMIKDHTATVTGNVSSPSASSNRVDKVVNTVSEQIGAFELVVADKVSTNELEAYKATIENLIAGKAEIEDLEVTNAEIENLKVKDAEIENAIIDKATIEDLEAINAKIENLEVKDAEIENAVIDNLEATKAEITLLEADFAQIKTLVSGNLTSDNILSFNITADKVTMEDAFIKDAMIDTVNASKINAGKINTNSVVIGSEDGGMLITGATQQFTDKNGNVRIQIGRDTSGDFTFALYGEDGQGQLINQNGITASAIADGLIVNDMVSNDAAISGDKLDISSVVTEINNDNTTTIKSNKIYLDEQNQSLEVAFKSLKTQVDTIKDIDSDLTTITDKIQSNTSKIEANKSSISTLLAEDAVIKKQVTDLEGNVVETTNTLTSKYTSLQQNLDGFKTTVNNTYATKTSVNDVKNNLSSNYSTTSAMNSAIEQKVDEISASVSSTYATKNEVKTIDDNIKANYSTTEQMESAISVAKDEINLGISKVYETKTNVESKISSSASSTLTSAKSYADTKKSEAISTASSDATSKANNALTSAKSYTDTAKNALNTEIGKKANSTDVYTKTQTYTKTEVDSAIKLSKDTIELGVSQKYETKEEVTNKVVDAVNNIKVGGRNYLLNSNFAKTTLNGVTNKNPNLYPAAWYGYNGGISNPTTNYHAHIDNDTFGYNVVEYNETDGTRHWKGISQGNLQNRIKNVGEFTISMDVYATMSGTKTWGGFHYTKVGGTTQNFHSGSFTINSDKISVGKWTRVTTKVPMNSDVDFNKDITFFIYGYGFTSNAILYIKNVTLSQGTTGLDWCPAPEEVDSEISSAKSNAITESKNYTDSQIKISKDAIELGISQKYETKSNVTSQVSTALTSAKSYADTKKSEAISAASSDATSKANSALNSAKSYADTKKNEAITSANNTLTTTIKNYYTKTETDSQINVAKNAITQSVSSTYETKAEVTNKINGIKIGGRNLIKKKSEFMYGYISQSNGSLNNTGSSLNSNQDFYTNEYFPLKTGESVCFTSYPKQTVNSSIKSAAFIHVYNSSKVWQKAIYHDTNTANATANKIYTATEDCYVRFCSRGFNDYNHMAEYATKPSQWSPAPEDVETTVSTIEQRVSAAESKITDTAITNTVKKNFYTKEETNNQITSKGYQTASQVQQTVDNLQIKFTESGGYNLLRNGKAALNTNFWVSNGGGISRGTDTVYKTCFKTSLPSGIKYNGGDNGGSLRLKNNTHYVYEAMVYSRTAIGGNATAPLHYWCNTTAETAGQAQCTVVDYSQAVPNINTWTKCYVHFVTKPSGEVWFTPFVYTGGSFTGDIWVTELSLSESSIKMPYSPHPSEVYDGLTQIDKEGVTVTASNVRSKTKMSADGFQLIRTTDNKKMFYVNQDGSLEMSGNFTQYDTNGKMSIKIANNSYSCYDWLWNGDYVGKLGAFDTNRTNTSGTSTRFIGLSAVADYGNQLALGVRSDTTSGKFKAYLEIDNTGSMHRDYVTLVANTGFKTNAIFRNGSNNNNETGRIFGATNDHFCVASNYHNQLRFCYEKNGDYHTAMSVYRNDNTSAGCAIEYYADEVHHKNVTISGFLSVRGQKNRLVATENFGDRLLNAYETAECYFGDINEAIIGEDGEVKVELDEVFLETVNTTETYQVFLTKYGEGDCYVSERHEKYFVIKGTPNLSVGFEVKAKQRGYEKERLKMTVNTLKSHQAESLENKAGEVIDCEIADNRG